MTPSLTAVVEARKLRPLLPEKEAFYGAACPYHDHPVAAPDNLRLRRGWDTFHCFFCGARGRVESIRYFDDGVAAAVIVREP